MVFFRDLQSSCSGSSLVLAATNQAEERRERSHGRSKEEKQNEISRGSPRLSLFRNYLL